MPAIKSQTLAEREAELEYEQDINRSHKLLKTFLAIVFSYQAITYAINFVDDKIEGKWRDLPGFNLLSHPDLDSYRSFQEISANAGFNVEQHTVTTDDGYINTLFRLNNGSKVKEEQRPAVLLVHGLIDSADCWIINGRNNSHAFVLADQGYDVWLANNRGNKYSLNHTILDSEFDQQYWDNAHQISIAKFDIPAFIEHIKLNSQVNSVTYIGHSQATQILFYNIAHNTSYYEQNINLMVGLGPFISIDITRYANMAQVLSWKMLEPVMGTFKIYMANYNTVWRTTFGYLTSYGAPVADYLIKFIASSDNSAADQERNKVYFWHYPAGSSIRCWHHIGQQHISKGLFEYNWGAEKNKQLYGQERAPRAPIEKIQHARVPIVMVVGKHDIMVTPQNSIKAKNLFGKAVVDYIEVEGGHNIFVVGKDNAWFKNKVMSHIGKYNKI